MGSEILLIPFVRLVYTVWKADLRAFFSPAVRGGSGPQPGLILIPIKSWHNFFMYCLLKHCNLHTLIGHDIFMYSQPVTWATAVHRGFWTQEEATPLPQPQRLLVRFPIGISAFQLLTFLRAGALWWWGPAGALFDCPILGRAVKTFASTPSVLDSSPTFLTDPAGMKPWLPLLLPFFCSHQYLLYLPYFLIIFSKFLPCWEESCDSPQPLPILVN